MHPALGLSCPQRNLAANNALTHSLPPMHSLSKGVCPSGPSGLSMIRLLVAASIACKHARRLSALPSAVCLGGGEMVLYSVLGHVVVCLSVVWRCVLHVYFFQLGRRRSGRSLQCRGAWGTNMPIICRPSKVSKNTNGYQHHSNAENLN